ncbi:MAG: Rrf2 family transcriptional regulator [Candidatus Omnitrophota bacterium]|nr:Rrf2 family transcriptional regulator [Candidatus Omnitrophota bacterium]
MRLTSKTSYGIRALVDLAIMYSRKSPVSIRKISREEGISSIYLEQIFNRLKNHGIVKSIRGPRGGYMLARSPSEISVYDAIDALEGEVTSVGCRSGRIKGAACKQAGRCVSKEVWDEVTGQIQKTLKSFSLKCLAKRAIEIDPGKFEQEAP